MHTYAIWYVSLYVFTAEAMNRFSFYFCCYFCFSFQFVFVQIKPDDTSGTYDKRVHVNTWSMFVPLFLSSTLSLNLFLPLALIGMILLERWCVSFVCLFVRLGSVRFGLFRFFHIFFSRYLSALIQYFRLKWSTFAGEQQRTMKIEQRKADHISCFVWPLFLLPPLLLLLLLIHWHGKKLSSAHNKRKICCLVYWIQYKYSFIECIRMYVILYCSIFFLISSSLCVLSTTNWEQ